VPIGPIKDRFISARLSAAKQANDIEDLIVMGVNLIMVCPHQSEALSPSIKRIYNAGIPLMSFDRKLALDVQDLAISHVGVDFEKQGYLADKTIAKMLNGKGGILVLEGVIGSFSNVERMKELHKALDEYPDLKIITS